MSNGHHQHGADTATNVDADEPAADDDATRSPNPPLTHRGSSRRSENERPARLSPRGSSRLFVTPSAVQPLNDAASRDEADEHDHDRDNEQKVDQAASDVKDAEAENPQNEKNDRQCPKHCSSPRSRVSSTAYS